MWDFLDKVQGKDVLKLSLIGIAIIVLLAIIIAVARFLKKPKDTTCKKKECNLLGLACKWLDDPTCIEKTPDVAPNPNEDLSKGDGMKRPNGTYNISGDLIGLAEEFYKVINSYYYFLNGSRCKVLTKMQDKEVTTDNELKAVANYYKSRYSVTLRSELLDVSDIDGACAFSNPKLGLIARLDELMIP